MKFARFTQISLSALLFSSGSINLAHAQDFSAPKTIVIPAGSFMTGSSPKEKEYAYSIDEKAYGHSVTRNQQWYAGEALPKKIFLREYHIMVTPVTNSAYAQFISETGHPLPQVKEKTWTSYGLIHSFKTTRPYQWTNETPPKSRKNHPVVLVSHDDATLYAKWLSHKTGQTWRLPIEHEWEKAARGTDGRYFPWGNRFEPSKLNSHDLGKFSTTEVGHFPGGGKLYC